MILIVEDVLSNQAILKQVLTRILKKQQEIICIEEGAQAISFIEEHQGSINFIILDGNLANKHLAKKKDQWPGCGSSYSSEYSCNCLD